MDHLQAVASLLRNQLAEIEAKIAEIKPKAVKLSSPISMKEMRETAAGWYKTKKWKEFVLEEACGVIENIHRLLNDCYGAYVEYIKENFPTKSSVSIIGEKNSPEWQQFQLEVIKKLISPSKMDDDFFDTAGGCDEVAWEKGLDIIKSLA